MKRLELLKGMNLYKPEILERFWSKVNFPHCGDKEINQCWKFKSSARCPAFYVHGVNIFATRFAFAFLCNNNIMPPSYMEVCHHCDNSKCVHPLHLFLGTHQENMDDKVRKGRQAKGVKSGQAKLTEQQVREIRQHLKEGKYSQRNIAVLFNVSRGPIDQINKGLIWKHVI